MRQLHWYRIRRAVEQLAERFHYIDCKFICLPFTEVGEVTWDSKEFSMELLKHSDGKELNIQDGHASRCVETLAMATQRDLDGNSQDDVRLLFR